MFSWQVSEMSKVERLNRMNFLLRGLAFKYHFVKGPPSKLANDSIDRSVSWIHWNCKWLPLLGLAFVSENECLKMMHVKRDWTCWLLPQPIQKPTILLGALLDGRASTYQEESTSGNGGHHF